MASPQKRIAEIDEHTVCKRARLSESEAASTCSRLANVLLENPLVARTLMESLLKNSIALPATERGERQEKLASEVADVVQTLSSWKAVEVDQLKASEAELRAEWTSFDESRQKAEAHAVAAQSHYMDLAVVAANDSAAADAAEVAVKEKAAENQVEDKAFDLLVKNKERLQQAVDDLQTLRSEDVEKTKMAKIIKSVSALGAAHAFDSTMMEMLPSCLVKPVSERGDFDVMCMDSVEQAMKDKLAELRQEVEAKAEAKEQSAKQLEGLRAAATSAAEVHRASQAKADEAKTVETEAKQRGADAERKAEKVRVKISEVEVQLKAAIAASDAFKASAVADMERLRCQEVKEIEVSEPSAILVGHAGA